MSRLTIDMTSQQHQSLKALAALQRKTIKQDARERLLPGNVVDDQAWQELKTLLQARINDGLAGKVSAKSIQEVLDDELTEGSPSRQILVFWPFTYGIFRRDRSTSSQSTR